MTATKLKPFNDEVERMSKYQLIDYFGESNNIDNGGIILELEDAAKRITGSGLLRVDDMTTPCIAHCLSQMPVNRHAAWGMIHMPGGHEVPWHAHNDWFTAIYYPAYSSVCLLVEREDGPANAYNPKAGHVVTLARGVRHAVEENNTNLPRYSLVVTYAS